MELYRASSFSAGLDICSVEAGLIEPGEIAAFNTGIAVSPPEGTFCQLLSRSSLALYHKITVEGGIIDADYRGAIKVILNNQSRKNYYVYPGARIAQLVCQKIDYPSVIEVTSLDTTQRGSLGFGSSNMVNFF